MSRSGRRRRRLTVGLLVLAGVGLLGTAAGLVLAHARAPAERGRYAVRQVEGSERVELLAGRIDLPALAEALARDGRANILARRDGAWLLTRTLTVRRGASLTVGGATLRLLSEPRRFAGLEARGGRLEIVDSTVTSWSASRGRPDAEVGDGRAWVLARDGSMMNVRNSRMELLGYDRAERYGVSWRTRATSGAIDRSVFTGNFYGAYMHGIAAMAVTGSVIEKSHRYGLDPHSGSRNLHIENNIFRHNGKHGMILAVGCSNATVRGNQSYANAGHGIVVFEGSNDATLSGNEVHDNKLSGIDVNNSLRLRLTGNVVYGNDIGLHVHGRSRSVTADANRLTANRVDGLRVATGASAVRRPGT